MKDTPEFHDVTAEELQSIDGGLLQQMMESLKLMSEILGDVLPTRSEISSTLARNTRG